jgi:NADPH:quinone reductase-like Zn-dependent oxidoreductase
MKAIRYETFGPPVTMQLKEVAKPVPMPHQVLVKVLAASINAKEWRRFEMPSFPVRLLTDGWFKPKDTAIGTDVAGIVEAVGESLRRSRDGRVQRTECRYGAFPRRRPGKIPRKPAGSMI